MYLRNKTLSYILYLVVYWRHLVVSSLQITNLFVPREASHEALLDCRYSLGSNETLYDVKWYKDGSEFFRCKANGSVQQFSVDGVKLYTSELAQRGSCPLTLTGLNEKSSGEYSCEVSLDFPFQTEAKASKLNFVLPSMIHIGDASNNTEGYERHYNPNVADKYFRDPFLIALPLFLLVICK